MRAIQIKLDELIAALEGSSNRLIDVEDLSDRELETLYQKFRRLARDAKHLDPGEKTTIEIETENDDGTRRRRKRLTHRPAKH